MRAKGYFTVEASMLLPLYIFAMAASMNYAVKFHEIVKQSAEVRQEYRDFSPEKTIYALRFADAIKDEITD